MNWTSRKKSSMVLWNTPAYRNEDSVGYQPTETSNWLAVSGFSSGLPPL